MVKKYINAPLDWLHKPIFESCSKNVLKMAIYIYYLKSVTKNNIIRVAPKQAEKLFGIADRYFLSSLKTLKEFGLIDFEYIPHKPITVKVIEMEDGDKDNLFDDYIISSTSGKQKIQCKKLKF